MLFKSLKIALLFGLLALTGAGCMTARYDITGTTPVVKLDIEDLEVTEPLEATAVTIKVFGVDWQRLFSSQSAEIRGSVYSSLISMSRTENYAVYNLLKKNTGYDVVLYPQFSKVVRKPFLGMGMIYNVTEVKVTARMAKLKTN
jgi:hypothetical protein